MNPASLNVVVFLVAALLMWRLDRLSKQLEAVRDLLLVELGNEETKNETLQAIEWEKKERRKEQRQFWIFWGVVTISSRLPGWPAARNHGRCPPSPDDAKRTATSRVGMSSTTTYRWDGSASARGCRKMLRSGDGSAGSFRSRIAASALMVSRPPSSRRAPTDAESGGEHAPRLAFLV